MSSVCLLGLRVSRFFSETPPPRHLHTCLCLDLSDDHRVTSVAEGIFGVLFGFERGPRWLRLARVEVRGRGSSCLHSSPPCPTNEDLLKGVYGSVRHDALLQ